MIIAMGVAEIQVERFLRTVEITISDKRMFGVNDRVLVGLSGGPDSVALLWSLHLLAPKGGFHLSAAHLNHGLRGKDAEADAEFAAEFAARLNIPFTIDTADVSSFQKIHGLSPEEAARDVRYSFLHGVSQSQGCSKIALGHHADDNAELVLMNFIRGTGLTGLAGIPAVRSLQRIESSYDGVRIVRPLIRLTREEIYTFLRASGLSWQTDHSNCETRYLRNRIRLGLLPTLKKEFNSNIVKTLNRLADAVRNEDEWITDMLFPVLTSIITEEDEHSLVLSVDQLVLQPKAATRRLVRMAIKKVKGNLRRITFDHVESILQLCGSGDRRRRIDLPDRLRVERNDGRLIIVRCQIELRRVLPRVSQPSDPGSRLLIDRLGVHFFKELDITLIIEVLPTGVVEDLYKADRAIGFFDFDRLAFPLTIRHALPGDKFHPLGVGGSQKVKKFFIDHKIPLARRSRYPVLMSAENIIWVIGLRIDERYKVTISTKKILKIELRLAELIQDN